MTQRPATRPTAASAAIAALTIALAGCARNVPPSSVAAPEALGTVELAPLDTWRPAGPRPLQRIDDPGEVAWDIVEPTIIDTRTFPNQVRPARLPAEVPLAGSDILPGHDAIELARPDGDRAAPPAVSGTSGSGVLLGRGWTAIQQLGWNPPDPALAVGPDHVVVTVNQEIAWYTKGGELQFLAPVWNLPLRIGYARNLDPVLDEDDGRFFVTLAVRF